MDEEKNAYDRAKLRQLAEKALEESADDLVDLSEKSPEDMASLNHELRVHQIELEMQNEELRRSQLELETSRNRFKDLFEFAPVGYFTLDAEWMIREVNLTGVAMLGFERQQTIDKGFFRFILPEFQDTFYRHRRSVMETGKPQRCELKLRKKDGTAFFVQMESLSVGDDKNPVAFIRVILTDIDDLKRTDEKLRLAQNELRLKEEKNKAIFASVQEGMVTVDRNMVIIEANKALRKICGLKPEGIIGRNFTSVPKMCRKACEDVLSQVLQTRTPVNAYRSECRHQERPGNHVLISSAPLLGASQDFQGAVLVIQDIAPATEGEQTKRDRFHRIIGKNVKMQEIYKLIQLISGTDTTLLITGESGTGKEVVADAIHATGNRSQKPLIKVNCSSLSEPLLESELFGHVKGAFTGAVADSKGRFEVAEGGTLLLDEIGDISPRIQSKMLRVLQMKEFERVGNSHTRKSNVRIIATTNKNLVAMVKNGEFREDLYFRLKIIEITIPPLRERQEDILLLAHHFVDLLNKQRQSRIENFTHDAESLLSHYPWPGNVRELEHAIEHASVFCNDTTITSHHLPPEIRRQPANGKATLVRSAGPTDERSSVLRALVKSGWNKSKAARMLGIHRKNPVSQNKKVWHHRAKTITAVASRPTFVAPHMCDMSQSCHGAFYIEIAPTH